MRKINQKLLFIIFLLVLLIPFALADNESYGEMWNFSSTGFELEIPVFSVYYNLSNLTVGNLNGINFTTTNRSDGGSYLTVSSSGFYHVSYSASFGGGGNNFYGVGVAKNETMQRNCYNRFELGAAGSTVNIAGSCVLELESNDRINMQIEDETNPPTNIYIYTINVHITELNTEEEHYNNLLFGLFLIIAAVLYLLGRKTGDPMYYTFTGILLMCFGIAIYTNSFPHFSYDTSMLHELFTIAIFGTGLYIMAQGIVGYFEQVED